MVGTRYQWTSGFLENRKIALSIIREEKKVDSKNMRYKKLKSKKVTNIAAYEKIITASLHYHSFKANQNSHEVKDHISSKKIVLPNGVILLPQVR